MSFRGNVCVGGFAKRNNKEVYGVKWAERHFGLRDLCLYFPGKYHMYTREKIENGGFFWPDSL